MWLSNLFGTSNAVNNLLDKDKGLIVRAGEALGNLHYSDQERANDDREVNEWSIRMLDALHPFKIIQRVLAVSAAFVWIFMFLNIVVAIWIHILFPDINAADPLMKLAFSDFIFWPILAIFALYTGGGTLNGLRGKK